jgi:hypothetical protein
MTGSMPPARRRREKAAACGVFALAAASNMRLIVKPVLDGSLGFVRFGRNGRGWRNKGRKGRQVRKGASEADASRRKEIRGNLCASGVEMAFEGVLQVRDETRLLRLVLGVQTEFWFIHARRNRPFAANSHIRSIEPMPIESRKSCLLPTRIHC